MTTEVKVLKTENRQSMVPLSQFYEISFFYFGVCIFEILNENVQQNGWDD